MKVFKQREKMENLKTVKKNDTFEHFEILEKHAKFGNFESLNNLNFEILKFHRLHLICYVIIYTQFFYLKCVQPCFFCLDETRFTQA